MVTSLPISEDNHAERKEERGKKWCEREGGGKPKSTNSNLQRRGEEKKGFPGRPSNGKIRIKVQRIPGSRNCLTKEEEGDVKKKTDIGKLGEERGGRKRDLSSKTKLKKKDASRGDKNPKIGRKSEKERDKLLDWSRLK